MFLPTSCVEWLTYNAMAVSVPANTIFYRPPLITCFRFSAFLPNNGLLHNGKMFRPSSKEAGVFLRLFNCYFLYSLRPLYLIYIIIRGHVHLHGSCRKPSFAFSGCPWDSHLFLFPSFSFFFAPGDSWVFSCLAGDLDLDLDLRSRLSLLPGDRDLGDPDALSRRFLSFPRRLGDLALRSGDLDLRLRSCSFSLMIT